MTEIEDLIKTTTKGSLILLLGQISSTLVLAIGMLLVARFLGPANYGSFHKTHSVISIALLLINLGLNGAIIRYIAQYRHEEKKGEINKLIETSLLINLTASTIITAIVYLSAGYIANNLYNDPTQEPLIKYLSLVIIGQSFLNLSNSIAVGFERMEYRSISQVIQGISKSILSPTLVYMGLGTMGAVIGTTGTSLLSGLIGTIFVVLLYNKNKSESTTLTHLDASKTLLSYGFPLYLSAILNGILPQLYTTLLGVWVTDTEIGNYGVAANFTVLLSFVTTPIATTIFPLFSKLKTSQPELEFLYRNAVKYSTLFAYPIIWTLIALAEPIIEVLYQSQYTHAARYLQIYIASHTLIGLGSIVNHTLLKSQKRTDLTFKSTLIRFITSVPLSIVAIRYMGVPGLILAFFISLAVNTSIDYININRLYGYRINTKFLTKILFTSITTALIVNTTINQLTLNPWIELVIGGTLSLTLYIIGFIATKMLTHKDLEYLKRITTSLGPLTPAINKLLELIEQFI